MSATGFPPILRDRLGDPLPIVWDDEAKVWRVLKGFEHGQQARLLDKNGNPISSENPLPVQGQVTLTGQTVTIGGTSYEFDPPRTLYGPAGSRPNAAAAHAAVPYAVYVSVDAKVIEMTDGTAWRRWGVV